MISVFAALCIFTVAFGARIPSNDQPGIEEHIVGGNQTEIEQVPYQIALFVGSRFICGGSIIGPKHVVTAAHCVEDFSGEKFTFNVRAGTANRSSGGVFIRAKKVAYHPQYSPDTVDYDVAVVELEAPLNFSKSIKVIKMGDKVPADGQPVLVSGWGCTKENGLCPTYLQSVTVPMINKKICEKNYVKYFQVTPRMICAGIEGKDACQGDSGGPLTYQGQLVGVVSTGLGCARKDFPGIYTNIADPDVRAFIKKISNI